jgi:hypothetical protein
MPWWMWVSTLLAWVVLASAGALWLGASAKVVRRREREAAHRRHDDPLGREWDVDRATDDDGLRREWREAG